MIGKSASDFAHFYATDLLIELKRLEIVRRAVLGKVKILITVAAGLALSVIAIELAFGINWTLLLLAGILLIGGGSGAYKLIISGYVHQFKVCVMKKIVEFIDPDLTYWAKGHVSATEFNSSRIFTQYPDRMRGDDLVEGRIGLTNIKFSEVHAERKSETTDQHGRRRKRYSTIFKGLFFMADFNKRFYGKTVVLPDTAERLLGGAGSFLQSLNRSRGQVIRMDNPEFEKYFVVYGDDQIESRYVLSPSLLQRIVDFKEKTGKRVYLSFVGSEVFVAVPYRRHLFEPRVFSKITSFKSVRQYFDDLELALGIVEDLNLNTRIWAGASSAGV